VDERAEPYVLPAGHTRRDDALLPILATSTDTGGLLTVCAFTLGPWDSGPVLHSHRSTDEALFVVSGTLLAQLGGSRSEVAAGGFVWMPRGVPHAFANAGADPVHVVALAVPGGLDDMFAEQAAYLASLQGPPDPAVMEEIGLRHQGPTLGPPIRADGAPPVP